MYCFLILKGFRIHKNLNFLKIFQYFQPTKFDSKYILKPKYQIKNQNTFFSKQIYLKVFRPCISNWRKKYCRISKKFFYMATLNLKKIFFSAIFFYFNDFSYSMFFYGFIERLQFDENDIFT